MEGYLVSQESISDNLYKNCIYTAQNVHILWNLMYFKIHWQEILEIGLSVK